MVRRRNPAGKVRAQTVRCVAIAPGVTAPDIARVMRLPVQRVRNELARAADAGDLERVGRGAYRATFRDDFRPVERLAKSMGYERQGLSDGLTAQGDSWRGAGRD